MNIVRKRNYKVILYKSLFRLAYKKNDFNVHLF